MEQCNYLAFLIDTWEESYNASNTEAAQVAPNDSGSRRAGRPAHVRSHYLESHPKWQTHRRVFRGMKHNTLPQIAGPWFPRRDDPQVYDFYCACMLALLKPWRTATDLKTDSATWSETFEAFITNSPPIIRRIVAGIQYFYDSKSASESSPETDVAEGQSYRREHEVFVDTGEEEMGVATAMADDLVITENDLEKYKKDQESTREEAHADDAIYIGLSHGLFRTEGSFKASNVASYHFATGQNMLQLESWKATMKSMVVVGSVADGFAENEASVDAMEDVPEWQDVGNTRLLSDYGPGGSGLEPSRLLDLLEEQRRAYDIIDMHLQCYLSGGKPPQLRMFIPGEAGVGKSMTVQTVTANFISRGVGAMLIKGAYTGIAASAIDGKTLHFIAMIPLNGGKQSPQTIKALEVYWADKNYLIIDEISMVSREMFAKLSNIIARARAPQVFSPEDPFGGLNVILVGDFHQFPPVASGGTSALYVPSDASKDSPLAMLGRKLYEQFDVVVRLTIQVRVTDSVWVDLLRRTRHGKCTEMDLAMLRGLVLTDTRCPATDFSQPPWSEAVLITPRHAVRMKWNSMKAHTKTRGIGLTLITCPAFDTVQGRQLNVNEKYALATKPKKGSRDRRHEHGGLPDEVELAIGMEVMVTFNVATDLDLANGARGHIVDIVLNEREEAPNESTHYMRLQYPPLYMLVSMNRTKANALEGLEVGVLPVAPLTRTFVVTTPNQKKGVDFQTTTPHHPCVRIHRLPRTSSNH